MDISPNEPLTLDNCDKEPIHVPGTIQPFGVLLAGTIRLDQITYCSGNIEEFIPTTVRQILGANFDSVLTVDALHDLRNILSLSSSKSQRERVGIYPVLGRQMELYAHRNRDDIAVIELEPVESDGSTTVDRPLDKMRSILARVGQEHDLIKMLRIAVVGFRGFTGYNRVKAYRYASDGSGEVVAEDRDAAIDSFLGLHYPAWDVPAQARALQVKNPVRMLSSVAQTPVDILGHDAGAPPLDMSLAHLRGISPIHVQYLKNMGVGATLTVGLVIDGKLWGMLACHHMTPRIITSDTRIAAEMFGQFLSLLIQKQIERNAAEARGRAAEARRRILSETDAELDLLNAFRDLVPIFQDVVECDGIAVTRDGKLLTHGSVPTPDAIRAIAARLPDDENLVEGCEALSLAGWAKDANLQKSAGAMIVRSTAAFPLQLIFFRDEIIQNITWAGRPDKVLEDGPFGARISPRGSFDAFIEEQQGRSQPWRKGDIAAARELQILLTQVTAKGERSQVARQKDLENHQRQQDLLIAELNHRVKNILALIRSLSRQAKASSASLDSYARALEQRIAALASAHDLAVSGSMQGVSLRGILETELQPYLSDDAAQVLMSGPVVGLRADVAPMIALVFHEIVTNAAKYGALSVEDGIVQAKWNLSDEGLKFSWREMSGPPVVGPKRHGFGQALIQKAIPYEFDGKVNLDYDPGGVRMTFEIPPDTLVDLEAETPVKLSRSVPEVADVATGKTILLLEDNTVLAMDMVESLTRLGAERIETASTVRAAQREVERMRFDAAVLDMNLRGEVSFDIAERLLADGVPFIFVTGYGSQIDMPQALGDIQILTKPIDDASLSNALKRLF